MHELLGLNLEVPGFACAQSGRRASRLPAGDATRHHGRQSSERWNFYVEKNLEAP